MSKLDELIQELCPDGVINQPLVKTSKIKRGVRVVKSQLASEGKYPVYQNSMTPLGYYEESNSPANTVFIIVAGAAGEIGYSMVDFWAADDCFCFVCPENLNSRYLYHVLLNQKQFILSRVRRASVPRLDRSVVENLLIPLPPLPVQREIVRILDSFTELTAELTAELIAELIARKKQYEYYQDELLTFGDEVPMVALGETCQMKSGKAISSAHICSRMDESTPFACFGGNGVRGYVKEASHHGEYPLIGRQGALCGNVNYASGDFYATEHAVVVKSRGKYNQRFLFHLLTTMNLNKYKSQGAQPGLAVGNIENILAPLPSLKKQERIVAILDRFDTLCNDISIGLPAEIEARKKQYEYYRDKLLTFPEAKA